MNFVCQRKTNFEYIKLSWFLQKLWHRCSRSRCHQCSIKSSPSSFLAFFFAAVIQRNNEKAPIKSDKFVVFLFAFSYQIFVFVFFSSPFQGNNQKHLNEGGKKQEEIVKHMKSRFSQVNGFRFTRLFFALSNLQREREDKG